MIRYGKFLSSPVLKSPALRSDRISRTLTLSCYKMPISTLFRFLSDDFGVGLVYADSLSDKTVTAEFKEADFSSVLDVISRQIDSEIVKVGNTFFVGKLRPQDQAVLFRRVYGYKPDELLTLIQSHLSSSGKCSALSSGVVTVSDHDSVIRRLTSVLDYVSSVDSGSWVLQLCFVVLRKEAFLQSGLDVTTSGSISYNVVENTVKLENFNIDGLFRLASNSSFFDLYASPMFTLLDGQESNWTDGVRVPVPRRTVSEQGTVTVSGYDYVDTGFIVKSTVNPCLKGGRLSLSVELSDIQGYVVESPIVRRSFLQVSVDMVPYRLYLLGELGQFKDNDSQKNILDLSRDSGKSVYQVWGQLYRISSGVYSAPDDLRPKMSSFPAKPLVPVETQRIPKPLQKASFGQN